LIIIIFLLETIQVKALDSTYCYVGFSPGSHPDCPTTLSTPILVSGQNSSTKTTKALCIRYCVSSGPCAGMTQFSSSTSGCTGQSRCVESVPFNSSTPGTGTGTGTTTPSTQGCPRRPTSRILQRLVPSPGSSNIAATTLQLIPQGKTFILSFCL
jgi:hypothetical protein